MVKYWELLNFAQSMAENNSKVLVLFDFDGTITCKDSMLEFVKFTNGNFQFYLSFIHLLPFWILYFFGLLNAQKMKEKFLAHFFIGKTQEELFRYGENFGKNQLPAICKPSAIRKIEYYKQEKCKIIVVSASSNLWLQAWADSIGLELICTELEFKNQVFTGKILGKNCNGEEKVNRIKAYLNLSDYKTIIAYGDSKGDLPMLSLANEAYFCHF